jgi:hypothetical protein
MIIFINGPRLSGKTTAIDYLRSTTPNSAVYKMSRPLESAAAELFQIDSDTWRKIYNHHKDDPIFKGKSPREILILLSNFLQQTFGPEALGNVACLALRTMIGDVVFVDAGKTVEVAPVADMYDCACIQLERPGCTFDEDTREYIDCEKLKIPVIKINNRHDLEMFKLQLDKAMSDLCHP